MAGCSGRERSYSRIINIRKGLPRIGGAPFNNRKEGLEADENKKIPTKISYYNIPIRTIIASYCFYLPAICRYGEI